MDRPLLSLCMIARDEEAVLTRCLETAGPYVDEIVVVDTGSADRTVELAERCGARIVRRSWDDDFSAARNASLDAASGRFVLVLDADEWIEGGCSADELRGLLATSNDDAFEVTLHDRLDGADERRYRIVRLFRNVPEHRYRGRFHEQITPSIAERRGETTVQPAASGLVVGHDGYLRDRRQARGKAARNLELLRRQVAEDPQDVGARYFLIRELVPIVNGRAIPGRHLDEALQQAHRLGRARRRLAGPLAVDLARIQAAALLACRRAGEALRLLDAEGEETPTFQLLRAEAQAELAGEDQAALEAALSVVQACFDRTEQGRLPSFEPALTQVAARARAAQLLLRLSRIDEARSLIADAVKLKGGGAVAWVTRAAIERAGGDLQAALRAYLEAVRRDACDPWCWAGLGEILLEIGAPADAIEPFSRAARLAPGWPRAEAGLAAAREAAAAPVTR